MAIYITARHMEGGYRHEHIARVKWQNTDDGSKTGENGRQEIVGWIRNDKGKAYVWDGSRAVIVLVVDGTPPYLRTFADGVWTDNLLALPEY